MRTLLIILLALVGTAWIVVILPGILFRRCKHPEKWATFVRNIYGDEINLLNGRSIWKAKWWLFFSYSSILMGGGIEYDAR